MDALAEVNEIAPCFTIFGRSRCSKRPCSITNYKLEKKIWNIFSLTLLLLGFDSYQGDENNSSSILIICHVSKYLFQPNWLWILWMYSCIHIVKNGASVLVDIHFYCKNLYNQTEKQYTQLAAFHRHTVWDLEIAGSSNFIKHQSKSTEIFLCFDCQTMSLLN